MRLLGITGLNMDITDAIRSHIEEKIQAFEKLVENFEPVAEIKVEAGKTTNRTNKGPHYKAAIQMTVPGEVFRAEEESEDLYEAIDKAKDTMKRQLTDHKNKLTDRSQRGSRPDKE